MQEVVCPKCHSNQITAGKKGFNNSTGALGMITGGSMTALAYGSAGSNQVIITCLMCGNQFKPGQGSVRSVNEQGEESVVKQEYSSDGKILRVFVAIFLLIVCIGLLLSIKGCYPENEVNRTAFVSADTVNNVQKSKSTIKKSAAKLKDKNRTEYTLKDGTPVYMYSDELGDHFYVHGISVNSNEKFFEGLKTFEGANDNVYEISITGDQIKIMSNEGEVLFIGSISEGKILDQEGKEGKFRFNDGTLYYHLKPNVWHICNEFTRPGKPS